MIDPAPDKAMFSSLNLDAQILRAIEEEGYTEPTPIQAQAIPHVLAGRDLMAMAQTGTGKTAAFTLPLLQRLLPHASTSASPARHPIRALILAPTRELAIQVEKSVETYSKHVPLRSTVVFGGIDIKTQKPALMKGVEILVATPAIRNLIRDDKVHQIYSTMQSGQEKYGMQTMNQSLARLTQSRVISRETAMASTSNREELTQMLERPRVTA